ncbi:MAG: NAD(P)-dependent oxidoreductase [Myxococcota bacterium]
MQLVFCGTGWLPIVDAIRVRLPTGASIRVRDLTRPLVEEVCDADVLVPSNAHLDATVINACPRLKLIQQSAAGYELIDVGAARARGIPVCNVPGANADAMAQTSLLLMLALARRLPEAQRSFAEARVGVPLGRELNGKVLGVVGLGRSGSRMADAARALGMQVISVGSTSGPDAWAAFWRSVDVISLHCPLNEKTRGLLNDAVFAQVKPGVLLVNCARAAIVDRGALERALDAGVVGGVGLDVHWEEPWNPAEPLYARPNVVALPHIGGSTEESFARLADGVAANIRRLMANEPLLNRVD